MSEVIRIRFQPAKETADGKKTYKVIPVISGGGESKSKGRGGMPGSHTSQFQVTSRDGADQSVQQAADIAH